jgi:hypothetical protein
MRAPFSMPFSMPFSIFRQALLQAFRVPFLASLVQVTALVALETNARFIALSFEVGFRNHSQHLHRSLCHRPSNGAKLFLECDCHLFKTFGREIGQLFSGCQRNL